MSSIQVKHVEPEIHDLLRQRAADAGCTLGEYVLELIRRDLRTPPRRQWLHEVRRLPRHDLGPDGVVRLVDEGRNER